MKARKFIQSAVVSCLILVLIISGCTSGNKPEAKQNGTKPSDSNQTGANQADKEKYGGTVNIRITQTPTNMGYPPTLVPPSGFLPIVQPAMETLGRYNPDGTMGPWLAESWDVDPKGKTITVKLRKGVKFHDGTDFNAEAVKYNMDLNLEAKRPLSASIDSVDAVDSHTVRFNLKYWTNSLLNDLFWIYPIASPKAYKEKGKDWMITHPVGTGPFKFDSMQKDVFIKWVRNDDYWQKGLPYLDGINMQIIVDPNTARNTFLSKESDILTQLPGDMLDAFKNFKDVEIVKPKTEVGLAGEGLVSDSNNPKSPFYDVRVRKAISYAIDRKKIAEVLYRGYVTASNQFNVPGSWVYNPDLDPFDLNVEKAKQLLTEAGYPNGFSTTLTGTPNEANLLQAIQGYLSNIGITAKINVVQTTKWNALVMTEGWEGLITYRYTTDRELASSMLPHFGPDANIYGNHSLRPEKVMKLINDYNTELDNDKRKKIAMDIQKAVFDEYAMVTSLYVETTPYLRQKKIQDDGTLTSRYLFFTPEKMWIKKN